MAKQPTPQSAGNGVEQLRPGMRFCCRDMFGHAEEGGGRVRPQRPAPARPIATSVG
jgi:hypothetical protein